MHAGSRRRRPCSSTERSSHAWRGSTATSGRSTPSGDGPGRLPSNPRRQPADAGDLVQPHMVLLHRRVVVIQAQLAVAAFIASDVAVLLHGWPHGHRAEQAAAIVQNQFHLRFAIQLRQQGFQARDLRGKVRVAHHEGIGADDLAAAFLEALRAQMSDQPENMEAIIAFLKTLTDEKFITNPEFYHQT